MTCYVDSHVHEFKGGRSVTGILILINNTPIMWQTKKEKTIEEATYMSELVAARRAVKTTLGLKYKLQMLGVPITGPARMYGDNTAVISSTMQPSSTMNNFRHLSGELNLADCLTKPLNADAFHRAVQPVLFRHKAMYDKTYKTSTPACGSTGPPIPETAALDGSTGKTPEIELPDGKPPE
jgi:hypothetical protein